MDGRGGGDARKRHGFTRRFRVGTSRPAVRAKAPLTPPEHLEATVSTHEAGTAFPPPARSRRFVKRLGTAPAPAPRRPLPLPQGAPPRGGKPPEGLHRPLLAAPHAVGIAFVLLAVLTPAFGPPLL